MKKLHFILVQIIISTLLFVAGAFANTFSLDPTFNGTGFNIQPALPSPGRSSSRSMAIQQDGKIVMGGYTVSNQEPREFALMRFKTDGTLDTSFGTNGIVRTTIGQYNYEAKVLIQPDGKILLGGNTTTNAASSEFGVIRYNADGSLDNSFNSTGYIITGAPGLAFDDFQDMILQSDGKIVLVGRTAQIPGSPNLDYNSIIVRITSNGSLDTTFNGSGILISGETGVEEGSRSVIVQPDGKILVGGYRLTNTYQSTLTRFNSDGTIDTAFGTGGKVTNNYGGSTSMVSTIGLQSDGKILAGGSGFIARYTTNGVLDPIFGTGGVVFASINQGKIRVLGDDSFLVTNDFAVTFSHFLKDGEGNYNSGAFISTPNYYCRLPALDIQSDGKIVIAGECTLNSDSISRFAVFRLQETVTYTKRHLDFDGDRVSNMTVFRPSTGQWLYLNTYYSEVTTATFGAATDRLVPADFTGDGRTDIAVWRPSTSEWFVLRSSNGTFFSFPFGAAGDIPIADDFDGDQIADACVFRPSTNQWFIRKSTGGVALTRFGAAGDKPVPSDYDGDNKTDIAIYRPSSGEWWIQKSSDGAVYAFQFGTATDKPVPGDYTGDNKTDAAFFRPSTGEWFILRSEDSSYYSIPFGVSDDLPAPGNYAGDARFDLVVYRPTTNTWHVLPTGGNYFYKIFGAAGDQPVANIFAP